MLHCLQSENETLEAVPEQMAVAGELELTWGMRSVSHRAWGSCTWGTGTCTAGWSLLLRNLSRLALLDSKLALSRAKLDRLECALLVSVPLSLLRRCPWKVSDGWISTGLAGLARVAPAPGQARNVGACKSAQLPEKASQNVVCPLRVTAGSCGLPDCDITWSSSRRSKASSDDTFDARPESSRKLVVLPPGPA